MNRILILAAAAAAALAMTAIAENGGQRHSRIVSSRDLDLAGQAGLGRLDGRLTTAIVDVCGEAPAYDPVGRNAVRRCRAALRQAVGQTRARLIASSAPQLFGSR